MNRLHSFKVTLTLRAPFLIAGTERRAWGVDVFQIRNAKRQPILPDTHLKGVLRHACDAAKVTLQPNLFGKDGAVAFAPVTEQTEHSDKTGRLILSDLVAKGLTTGTKGAGMNRRTRVKIEDDTGAAMRGHLLTAEEVAPLNTEVAFEGTALLWAPDAAAAKAEVATLVDAFALVAAVGRFKSVGYGEVVSFAMDWTGAETGLATPLPGVGPYDLTFGLSKPAMLAARVLDKNTLESQHRIPGAMIKGALATHLAFMGHDPREGALSAALTALQIGEATADRAVPRRDEDEVQLQGGATPSWFRWGKDLPDQAFAFPVDVKDTGDPQPPFDFETRTRLAINPATQAAKKGALFSHRMIRPEYADSTPVVWQVTVDASACPSATPDERQARDLMLAALMGGPATLGKTNARMTGVTARGTTAAAALAGHPGKVRVCLQTAALMLREAHLADADTYHAALRAWWQHVTGGAYALAMDDAPPGFPPLPAVFARLSYRGGFEARHFRFFGRDTVEPFVLTDPGSVFVLEPVGQPRPGVLEQLARTGLPLLEWDGLTPRASSQDWKACTYTPENGFGAIVLEGVQ